MTTTGMDAFEMSEEQALQDPPEGEDGKWGALRLIGFVALVSAFAGFVYLAYMQGVRNGSVGAPPVITADNRPYKVLPAAPGGRSFGSTDSKIMQRLEGEAVAENSHASPAPETPATLPDPNADRVLDPNTGALVVADVPTATPIPRPSGLTGATDYAPNAKGGPANPATVQSPQRISDASPAKPVQTPAPAKPAPVEAAPAPAPAATAEAAKPAPSAAKAGAYVIQIASYRDMPSAEDAWKKLVAKNADLVSKLSPNYQTADIPGKGTYYRLRVGPFDAKDDASAMCSALKARQQACLVVKG